MNSSDLVKITAIIFQFYKRSSYMSSRVSKARKSGAFNSIRDLRSSGMIEVSASSTDFQFYKRSSDLDHDFIDTSLIGIKLSIL